MKYFAGHSRNPVANLPLFGRPRHSCSEPGPSRPYGDPPASSSSAGAASDVKLTTSRSERRRRLRPAVAGAGSRSLHNSGQRGVHWNITVLEPSALVRMFETARCDPLFMQ